jgi:hypothetical protein
MMVTAAIGTTSPRSGIFISQNDTRVTRYSGRVDGRARQVTRLPRAANRARSNPDPARAEDRHPRRRKASRTGTLLADGS